MNEESLLGVILAGGESRRFGSPKAFATYKGETFITHSLKALKPNVDNIIVVSHPSITNQLKQLISLELIEDLPQYRGNGPLAGILSVMDKEIADWYVVLPCDTPKITQEIVQSLLILRKESDDIVIPIINGRMQPLIGVYHYRVKDIITELLNRKEFKMKSLLTQCHVNYITEKELGCLGSDFDNVNHPEDYQGLI